MTVRSWHSCRRTSCRGTDGVRVFTVDDGWGWIFTAPSSIGMPSVSAGMSASAATASPPCSRSPSGLAGLYGSTAAGAARGLALRMDHGSQYLSAQLQPTRSSSDLHPAVLRLASRRAPVIQRPSPMRFNRTPEGTNHPWSHLAATSRSCGTPSATSSNSTMPSGSFEKNGYLSPAQARQAWHAAISIRPAA